LNAPGPEVLRERSKWEYDGRRRPAWADEPRSGEQSVWDFPRPPRIERESRLVRVVHGDVVLAESRSALRVLETAGAPTVYLPETDVDRSLLVPNETVSLCEWKGAARHFDVRGPASSTAEAVWTYRDPYPEFARIRGWLAFHPARVDACWLGETRVAAQPGGYYGGWVTPDLAGPIKGGPGSGSW
jgi:uncharacterized protein (DUF427 family)